VNKIAQAVKSCTHTHTLLLALWWSRPSWWSWCDTDCSCWTNPHFHQGYLQDNWQFQCDWNVYIRGALTRQSDFMHSPFLLCLQYQLIN
jgi:hypothetical protein